MVLLHNYALPDETCAFTSPHSSVIEHDGSMYEALEPHVQKLLSHAETSICGVWTLRPWINTNTHKQSTMQICKDRFLGVPLSHLSFFFCPPHVVSPPLLCPPRFFQMTSSTVSHSNTMVMSRQLSRPAPLLCSSLHPSLVNNLPSFFILIFPPFCGHFIVAQRPRSRLTVAKVAEP